MAGSHEPITSGDYDEKALAITTGGRWRWEVRYSRCFNCSPLPSLSSTSSPVPLPHPFLSSLRCSRRLWLTSAGSSTVVLHSFSDGSSYSIVTVSVQGEVIEEHLISKLNFTWPQVSCVHGFPPRGSRVVFVTYKDSADEIQKFAFQFSTNSEAEDFVFTLKNIFSNENQAKTASVDLVSEISSQSEFVPPYRPDTSNMMTPSDTSETSINLPSEKKKVSQPMDEAAKSESDCSTFPPRFTSLVSSCSSEIKQAKIVMDPAAGCQDTDFKAQIAKYMQDSSFLEMLDKVDEVISELQGDFAL